MPPDPRKSDTRELQETHAPKVEGENGVNMTKRQHILSSCKSVHCALLASSYHK